MLASLRDVLTFSGVVSSASSMPQRKLKEKRKAPTPKTPTLKEVPQESAAVLWLMERTGFDKNELVCACPVCTVAAQEGVWAARSACGGYLAARKSRLRVCGHTICTRARRTSAPVLATDVAAQLELMVRFKKIAADRRVEGKGKKKREVVSVNGGGAHLC